MNFNVKDTTLYCSGTDSYRLARKTIQLDQGGKIFNVTIPNKSLVEVVRSLSEDNEKS